MLFFGSTILVVDIQDLHFGTRVFACVALFTFRKALVYKMIKTCKYVDSTNVGKCMHTY